VQTPSVVVLDTNIALDLLVFDDPACRPLDAALAGGAWRWIATAAMRGEFARVLGYPLIEARLARIGRGAAEVLAEFDRRAQAVDTPVAAAGIPVCDDPDDQPFVDLAVAHRALLLSKDRAVLQLRRALAERGVTVASAWPAPA